MVSPESVSSFEVVKEYVETKNQEALLVCLERYRSQAESIGEGKNAEVFALTNDPSFRGICAKKEKDIPLMLVNDIDTEFDYQKRMNDLGIRTPLNILRVINKKTKEKIMIMERIFGVTLRDISERGKQFPEKYDKKKFWAALRSQLDRIHEAGFIHRDLHADNIMIDENGAPVILDFGTMTRMLGEDNPYRQEIQKFNDATKRYERVTQNFNNDDEMFLSLKKQFSEDY